MDCLMFYHVLLMVFAAIAFCLLWVGYSTPGWLAVTFQEKEAHREYTVSSLNRSLWYDVLCPQELSDCRTCEIGRSQDCVEDMNFPNYTWHYNWIEDLISDKEEWVLWRVLMTLAVVCCTVGFIFVACLVCCRFTTTIYRRVATIAFFIWLVPAIIVWIPVAMVADMHEDVKDTVDNDIPHDSTLHVPYSVVIAAVGALMAIIVAIMLLWLTGICSRKKEKSEEYSETYSTSSKTRMTRGYLYSGQYPYYIGDRGPSYYYRDYYPSRQVEEVVVENPYLKKGPARKNGFDDRSAIYSERWYDNRSDLL